MPLIISTTIIHEIRSHLGVSNNDYVFLDVIYKLQCNPNNEHIGWCSLSQNEKAAEFSVSRQAIIDMEKRLIEKGLLEKNDKAHIRTTSVWYNMNIATINWSDISVPAASVLPKKIKEDTFEGIEKEYKGVVLTGPMLSNKEFLDAYNAFLSNKGKDKRRRCQRSDRALQAEVNVLIPFFDKNPSAVIAAIKEVDSKDWLSLNNDWFGNIFIKHNQKNNYVRKGSTSYDY